MVKACFARRCRTFRDDETGSITVLTLFMIIGMVFCSGIAVDLMRYEHHRARLQAALDAGVLAAANINVCLDDSRDPRALVQQHIDSQGYGSLASNVTVVADNGECSVAAQAQLAVNTIFMQLLDLDSIGGVSASAANHAVNSVEVSLVLDVSTSMSIEGRIDAMRPAAVDFVNTLYGPEGDHDVVMSLVPYATQVSLGPDLIGQFALEHGHDYSWCIDLDPSLYSSTSLPTGRTYVQSAHFDPYTNTNHLRWVPDAVQPTNPGPSSADNTSYDSAGGTPVSGSHEAVETITELNRMRRSPCNPDPNSFVLPFQTTPQPLIDRINALTPRGNTSIDQGARWGVALLDPAAQPVVDGLIGAGVVPADAAGSPSAYNAEPAKVMVLMSDGINTRNHEMSTAFRDQLSNVWLGRMTDRGPLTDHFAPGPYDYTDPIAGFRQGTADPEANSYYFVQSQEPGDADGDGIPNEEYFVVLMEHMADLDPDDLLEPSQMWVNTFEGEQQTWQELWARWPVITYVVSFLRDPNHERPWEDFWGDYSNLVTQYQHEEKNQQLLQTCRAARDAGVIVYAIGFEISDLGAEILSNCVASPAFFYRADAASIQETFDQIADSIKALRLTQ